MFRVQVIDGLPPVGYRAYAWLQIPFQGQKFCYRLAHPKTSDYNAFNPRDGQSRNFRWQLSGRIPDSEDYSDLGYFGGSISLMQGGFQDRWATPQDSIEFQLTPVGKLIDGSTGKPMTRTAPARGMALDVPIGIYTVGATFVSANWKREVLLVSDNKDAGFGSAATVGFTASGGSCMGTSGGAPGRAYVYWRFK